ncbi:MAG: formylglycine-generating enzyme family protein [Bacteroidaceae bacterium]|nr:formylglycine-generating enzyme family protein [Bacteroidaceae bacterium]
MLSELFSSMVFVEGGTFTMGAAKNQLKDAESDEKHPHQVTLSDYYICKYEVTQELWMLVMETNPSHFKGAHKPVENITWDDAQVFIKKLNELTGLQFRMPTEAEWEYAARGGKLSKGYKYAGSNSINEVAWYNGNSGNSTHDVGEKAPNELGLFDMSGNVYEWCQDWKAPYPSAAQTNPVGAEEGTNRVNRGGRWCGSSRACRTSDRSMSSPDYHFYHLGMRLAITNITK